MNIQNHDFEKIDIPKLNKLLDSGWLNIDYEEKMFLNEKKKDLIDAKFFQIHFAHAQASEQFNENGNKCRKFFLLKVRNKDSYFEIQIPKTSLYSVCDSENSQGKILYKKVEIKIDELKKLTIEQTSLPSSRTLDLLLSR